MSEQPRIDTERDPRLAALYRAASQDGPPPALDDAIRAAARRAVGSRPRRAGSPFGSSWRVPLSIAAVLVLSVSVVTLMREEAPEMTLPPAADSRPKAAESARAVEGTTPSALGSSTPDYPTPSGVGLKPSSPSAAGGLRRAEPGTSDTPRNTGFAASDTRREAGLAASDTKSKQEGASANRPASPTPSPRLFGGPASPEAFPGASLRDKLIVSPGQARQSTEAAQSDSVSSEAQRRLGAVVAPAETKALARSEADDNMREPERVREQPAMVPRVAKSAPAPAAERTTPLPPMTLEKRMAQSPSLMQSYTNQPPEKWLEQIEELHKQGKFDEVKANLDEFTKRYPRYTLPPSLKAWAKP